jgi:hypothetical protein
MAKRKKLPPRSRPRSLPLDHDTLANHIHDSLRKDLDDRNDWNEMRIQRYAKLRGWREEKKFPWPKASNAHLPFLMTECLRTQDTIHNAVLAKHPVVEAMAVQQINAGKQAMIDNVLDYQLFVEQQGEEILASLIQNYTQDANFLAYVPWVRYDESVNDLHIFPPIPEGQAVADAVMAAFRTIVQDVLVEDPLDADGFRWRVTFVEGGIERTAKIEAYIQEEGGRLELNVHREVRAYDGPVVISKSVDEYVVPWRCENVQPPSPANPNGAEHVFLLDYPTLDEIRRLKYESYYDACTDTDLEEIEAAAKEDPSTGEPNDELKQLKDEFEGVHGGQDRTRPEEASGAGKLTRIQAFLGWDVNDDGLAEQIVVTMIRETKTILRVRYLTEQYPSDPPLRPLAAAAYLPVEGRFYGMSLIELLESLHDLLKITFDQMVDAATIKNVPWFTYRPTSGLNPETIRIAPGEGVPMSNPREDIFVPQFASQGDAFGLNMISLLNQFAERASMQGELQYGRVPQGKASALRTSANVQNILAQGDARPERIMRRFFSGFKDIYRIMHELNQRFLAPEKQIRLMEPAPDGTAVYQSIDDIQMISGRMQFEFKAGMFNTDKQTSIQVLQTLMGTLINPMTLQLGVVTPEQVHNLLTDFIKLVQREPTRYLKAPQPGPPTITITAEEAAQIIYGGRLPTGTTPQEGHEPHLQKLQTFLSQPEAELMDEGTKTLFKVYMAQLQQAMQQQQQQQQLLQAAQQFQQQAGGGGPVSGGPGGTPGPQATGPPANPGISGNAQVGPNELLDESLPSAR